MIQHETERQFKVFMLKTRNSYFKIYIYIDSIMTFLKEIIFLEFNPFLFKNCVLLAIHAIYFLSV